MVRFLVAPVMVFMMLMLQGGMPAWEATVIASFLELARVWCAHLARDRTTVELRRWRLRVESGIFASFALALATYFFTAAYETHYWSPKGICSCFLFAEVLTQSGIFLQVAVKDATNRVKLLPTRRKSINDTKIALSVAVISIAPYLIIYAIGTIPHATEYWIENGAYEAKVFYLVSYWLIGVLIRMGLVAADREFRLALHMRTDQNSMVTGSR